MTAIDNTEYAPLKRRLEQHHEQFSPIYQGYLSDHGPMATLALIGLGASAEVAGAFLDQYQKRLEPLSRAAPEYREKLSDLRQDIAQFGTGALLHRELPALISGWPRDAYHPLIRIAFGYEFDIPQEVAAGLAYLRWRGADPKLIRLAEQMPQSGSEDRAGRADREEPFDADRAFRAMSGCATTVTPQRNFNACLTSVTTHLNFSAAASATLVQSRTLSRQALAVFDATHDFFALHLVTGAHAYRMLSQFAGELQQPIFTLGLLAGYAAIGAPEYQSPDKQPASVRLPVSRPSIGWLELIGEDEHRIKLAYSAMRQTEYWSDPAYALTARRYLR